MPTILGSLIDLIDLFGLIDLIDLFDLADLIEEPRQSCVCPVTTDLVVRVNVRTATCLGKNGSSSGGHPIVYLNTPALFKRFHGRSREQWHYSTGTIQAISPAL